MVVSVAASGHLTINFGGGQKQSILFPLLGELAVWGVSVWQVMCFDERVKTSRFRGFAE